jgi:hypothetical protein
MSPKPDVILVDGPSVVQAVQRARKLPARCVLDVAGGCLVAAIPIAKFAARPFQRPTQPERIRPRQ